MKKLILSILLGIIILPPFTFGFNNKLDAYSRSIIDKISFEMELPQKNPNSYKINYPLIQQDGQYYIDLLIQSESYDLSYITNNGGQIRAEYGNIINILVPFDKLEILLNNSNVLSAQIAKQVYTQLDKSRKDINTDSVHQGIDLPSKYDGKGVIIGVVDTGIDFNHKDFLGDNGTRILYLWDMSDVSDIDIPEGYTWGREYNKSQIDNSPELVLQKDGNGGGGHGTHVTGTASGSGRENINMKGIAPNADIIFVKAQRQHESGGFFSSTDILAACQYIFKKADELGKPAVINMSLGSPIGPHDGSTLDEIALSNMVKDGRIIVVAAGNEGSLPIHAGKQLSAGNIAETLILPINLCDIFPDFCPDIPNLFLTAADIWGDANIFDSVAVGVYDFSNPLDPKYIGEVIVAKGESISNKLLEIDDTVYGFISIDAQSTQLPTNNSFNVFITISNGGNENIQIDNYIWSLRFVIAKDGRVDLWAGVPVPQTLPLQGINGVQMKGDNSMTISNYANCKNVISAASYITKSEWIDIDDNSQNTNATVGDRSLFSSIGPTRDGRLSPTITAPGQIVFASMSSHLDEGIGYLRTYVLQGGKYIGMQGTSMASPHVAGVIALMLQSRPYLNFERIILHFIASARKDEFTGPTANTMWGLGKIDAYSAVREAATSVEEQSDIDISIFPNPSNGRIYIEFNTNIYLEDLVITDMLGYRIIDKLTNQKEIQLGRGYAIINLDSYPSGIYIIKLNYDNRIIAKPISIIK